MNLEILDNGFTLSMECRAILTHRTENPCLFVGKGQERMDMYRGNFDIEDYVVECSPLTYAKVSGDEIAFSTAPGQPVRLVLTLKDNQILFTAKDPSINRVWFRLVAEEPEHVWGGGEQMSYFDMRGRRFPLWTSEPGAGRDKSTEIIWKADVTGKSGGDYYNTNYPQPTYLTSSRIAVHVESTAYSVFDFRNADFHEIEIWAVPDRVELSAAETFVDLVGQLSTRFGRQPKAPDWVYGGAIIGLKDGENSFTRLENFRAVSVKVSGLWCEDWVGLRHTSFGARLFWDWQANEQRYPDLKQKIKALRAEGIRFLGYVNPYLCVDGPLFPIAEAAGYFATNEDGETALVDFGEYLRWKRPVQHPARWRRRPKSSAVLSPISSLTANHELVVIGVPHKS
ncbi:MAG TPA: hypothetical protein DDW73_03755 [Rhizobium sp.]|jgi:sulfoquinovosidase|nr:hypothetical protein [Rhizobium sp.]